MASTRLFIGLWPDDPLREALARHQDDWQWPRGAARVQPEKLHLTLHFLGDVDDALRPALQQALDGVAMAPVSLAWAASQAWGGGLVVLRMHDDPVLDTLHADVGQALQSLGLPVERRSYKPHVTLARKASGAVAPATLPRVPFEARDFVLMASVGGRYEVLSRHGAPTP